MRYTFKATLVIDSDDGPDDALNEYLVERDIRPAFVLVETTDEDDD